MLWQGCDCYDPPISQDAGLNSSQLQAILATRNPPSDDDCERDRDSSESIGRNFGLRLLVHRRLQLGRAL